MEQTSNNIFFKEQFLLENERTKFYDKSIQYPTTLLIIFVGAAIYSFNKYFRNGVINIYSEKDYAFAILFILFFISMIGTIAYLSKVFHDFGRTYAYLPNAEILFKYEKSLYKHYYKYSEESEYIEKRRDAKKKTCTEFENILTQYYINNTSFNQKINDKRAEYYSVTRTLLFINLAFLILIGTLGILN